MELLKGLNKAETANAKKPSNANKKTGKQEQKKRR